MKRFLLISPARAGSTSLRETLNQLDGVVCHGEIFAPARVLGLAILGAEYSRAFRARNKPEFYDATMNPAGAVACGAKILTHQFLAPTNAYYVARLMAAKPRVVFVWRRALVRRFQSEYLLRMGVGQRTEDDYRNLSVDDIEADCLHQMDMAAWVYQLLELHALDVRCVEFEDLVGDPNCVNDIAQFLGLTVDAVALRHDARSARAAARGKEPPTPSDAFRSPRLAAYEDVPFHAALERLRG